ncbi:protein disulfide isomerase CRELD1 isoform X1 [Callorhinchus milii]|uniref:protein disulfide-isomerase n=1 Tax=Callorhinchus milii TaxID=7868 RepID=A0A4W3JJU4_CALMI|nr:protein disulfide isomerase CRELD1 isoform X1 [Callorhinchus milii]XP_042195718.1 protein disulfide isomerase CRELD1 isoform X1 [Callorhinchus milii]|eukprot:gi/632946227/ref/XP_007888454.1/ PREDICTED: cysteine-rich with EGF-like domain protein 1 isoform X1 [Callorhinchus milii]
MEAPQNVLFPVFRLLLYASLSLLVQQSVASKQNPCQMCRHITENFKKGMEKTANKNFGGGNTDWESKNLARYKISETRLLEIMETLCESLNFDCNQMVEQNEEHLEKWWFKQQEAHPDLLQWLCLDTIKVCCPPGTFGPDCSSCKDRATKPCSGYGKCDGDGTRSGTGLCDCEHGYTGSTCLECADGFFEESRNESHLVCHECYTSCKKCTGPEDYKCRDCKTGWVLHDNKCVDIDECGTELARCTAGQYCVNGEGSYECRACDLACLTCMGGGPGRCKKCNKGYLMQGAKCMDIDECNSEVLRCTGKHEECKNTDGGFTCVCIDSYSKKDGVCIEDQPTMVLEEGLFDNVTEDEMVVLQQMFFGIIICALATLAAKGDMVFTSIFIGAIAATAGYWLSERSDRLIDGFLKGK